MEPHSHRPSDHNRVLRQERLAAEGLRRQTGKVEFILRQINQYHRLKDLLDRGVTDLWIPIPKKIVQRLVGVADSQAFLAAQKQCLDDGMQLDLIGEHLALLDSDSIGFVEGELLGKGGSGEIYQVFHPWTWVGFARKLMTRPSHNYQDHRNVMKQFKQELEAMQKVQHHHCVKLVLSCTSLETVTIFSSPVADRDLAQLLDSDLMSREVEILRLSIGCITSALAYLHQLDIRHKDLKPSNILVHGSNVLLTDFGSCHEFADTDISTTTGPATGTTPRYRAPEVTRSEDRNRLTDVWSLGCVLFEILSRLQGHKLSAMMNFWRNKGTKEAGFANNEDAVALWFGVLTEHWTEHQTETQHGFDRKYTWLCSFVYHVLLHRKRLLRPSVVQILERLQDLDAVYPVDTLVATCCAIHPGTVTSWLASCKDIPQWPVLDLMLADSKLSSIFLDTELRVLATSRNIPFFDDATTTLNGTGLERLVPATVEITRIREVASAMPEPQNLQDHRFATGDTFLEEITNSVFTCRLIDTTFWVETLNLMLNADGLPRPRTVQLSMQRLCLDRQPGYKAPLIVMTFDPNEGEVVGSSYRQGRDVWADGFHVAAISREEWEVTAYKSIANSVSERQRRYNDLLNERRTHIKGFKKVKCFHCQFLGRVCSGPLAGGCAQCQASHTTCRFSVEEVEYGGEAPRYIDLYAQIDELSVSRWGS